MYHRHNIGPPPQVRQGFARLCLHHLRTASTRGAASAADAADADTDDAVRLEALRLSAGGGELADETELMRALVANSAGRYRTMVRAALALAPSLSLSHAPALTHITVTDSRSHSRTISLARSHTLSHTHTQPLSYTHRHTRSHTHTLSHSLTYCHALPWLGSARRTFGVVQYGSPVSTGRRRSVGLHVEACNRQHSTCDATTYM